jgi:hypothetical protein
LESIDGGDSASVQGNGRQRKFMTLSTFAPKLTKMNSDVLSSASNKEILDKKVDEIEPSDFHQLYQEFIKN